MAKGEAKVTLTADISNFQAGLKEAESQLHEFVDSFTEGLGSTGEILTAMGPLTLGMAASFGAMAEAGKAVVELGEQFGEFGAHFQDLHETTGIAVSSLQQFDLAAQMSGTTVDAVAGAVTKMEANLIKGKSAFDALGLSVSQLKGESPDQMFQDVADKVENLSTSAEKVAALKDIFGKAGADLLPFIDDLERAKEAAEKFGLVLSDDDIAAGKELNTEFKTLSAVTSDLWKQLGADIAPGLTNFLKDVTEAVGKLGQLVHDNKSDITGFFGMLGQVGSFTVKAATNVASGQGLYAGLSGAWTDTLAGGSVEQFNQENAPWDGNPSSHTEAPGHYNPKGDADAQKQAAKDAAAAWRIFEEQMEQLRQADVAADKAAAESKKRNQADLVAGLKEQEDEQKVADRYATQFAQDFIKGQDEETKQFNDDIARQDAAWHEHQDRMLKDWQAVGSAIAGVTSILESLGMSSDSVGAKLGGLASSMASGIGGFLHTLSDPSSNMFDKISGGIGLAATAISGVVGVIKSIFGHDEGKAIGNDFGGGLSDGLVKAIESTETKDHVGRALAEDLNIDAILKETGADPSTMMGRIGDVMNALKLGVVPAADAIKSLGQDFLDLQTAAAGGSTASEAAMTQMILRARELGEHIPEMDAAVGKMLDDAMAGLDQFYKGLSPGSGGKGQSAANNTLFDAMFKASAAQLGLVDAFNKFEPTFEDMVKANKGGKLTGSAAEFAELEKLMKNDKYKGAASGAEGLAQFDKNLGDAGYSSQKTTDALSKSLESLFAQALKGAGESGLKGQKAEDAALKAVLPELVQLQHDQEAGAKLSPADQKLLAEAQKEGLLPMKTLAEQQLDALKQIAANTGRGGYGGGYASNDYRNNTGGATTAQRRAAAGQT